MCERIWLGKEKARPNWGINSDLFEIKDLLLICGRSVCEKVSIEARAVRMRFQFSRWHGTVPTFNDITTGAVRLFGSAVSSD